MKNRRIQEIKSKGFDMDIRKPSDDTLSNTPFEYVDFSKIKLGMQTLEDAVLKMDGQLGRANPKFSNAEDVLKAIHNHDLPFLRECSQYFYDVSGIYSRLCRYMAYLYKYDWVVTPYINESTDDMKTQNIVLDNFYKVLLHLDNSYIKSTFGEIALKVVVNGAYYGYVVSNDDRIVIQELLPKYCRSRFKVNNKPVIEFNMKFFDEMFKDTTQRMKMLNLYPKDFKKGYIAYKEGKLPPQFQGDSAGWYLLDVEAAFKFNLNDKDYPAFMSVIPAILDLDDAKGLDKKKSLQKLLKIIIQKMPVDKNGDLVFDVDEARELHNNAVRMLDKAVGVDVLTTFADVDVASMGDNTNTTATDDLTRIERAVYNEAGVSQMQFNTDGNIALEKSILNDEAAMLNLITQFEMFLNYCIKNFNKKPKKYYYRVQILNTTIYNYKEMAKLYKEQTQLGYSKMLPQIALGQSQSSILANAYFENDVLDLVHVFIPPLMSSTMNAEAVANANGRTNGSTSSEGGRPELADDQKSEKTLQNQESQS